MCVAYALLLLLLLLLLLCLIELFVRCGGRVRAADGRCSPTAAAASRPDDGPGMNKEDDTT